MQGIVVDRGVARLTDDLRLREPGLHEVVVRIMAAGLCDSDLKLYRGTTPAPMPVVMGHEGAGVVETVGRAVTRARPGDHVVIHTLRYCGTCRACRADRPTSCGAVPPAIAAPFRVGDRAVQQFAHTSVFVEQTIVHEQQVVVVDPHVPHRHAALMSCALLHGTGAVLRRARVATGDTVAVLGSGALAMAVMQAARIAGASQIVAVDNAGRGGDDGLVPGGFDHAFVCDGSESMVTAAVELLGVGGQCVIVAFPGAGPRADFEVRQLYHDKAILGSRAGSADPDIDIPQIARWYLDGRLTLDDLAGERVDLAGAVAAMERLSAEPGRRSGARVIVEP